MDTRWLSHDAACQTVKKTVSAGIASLKREAEEREDMLVVGYSWVVQKYNVIASLYMMCDALTKVSQLSRIFQLSTSGYVGHSHRYVATGYFKKFGYSNSFD